MSEFIQILVNGRNMWAAPPRVRITGDLSATSAATGDGICGDVLAKIFSYMPFWERAEVACVSRAFYAVYYQFVDNRPILSLMLDGDYLNVIRAFNRMTDEHRRMFTDSTHFTPMMVFGGAQTVRLLNAMGGIPTGAYLGVCHNILDRKFYLRTKLSLAEGKVFVAYTNSYPICSGDLAKAITCGRYDMAKMLLERYHGATSAIVTNPNIGDARKCPYPPDVIEAVGFALIAFHGRCVATTRLCMYHQTHSGLMSIVPPVVCEMHFHIQMSVKLLARCIGRARGANNATDEIWLQRAHPGIFIRAVLCATTESTYDCNIRNADLSDTFAVLGSLDDDKKAFT